MAPGAKCRFAWPRRRPGRSGTEAVGARWGTAIVDGLSVRRAAALVIVLGLPGAARAVEEDTVGWWIHAGWDRGALLSRLVGPDGMTPERAAIARAGRDCGLRARTGAGATFAATQPGAVPVVFGPFLHRGRVVASLACIRRYVPSAFVTQAGPPA